MGGSHFTIYVQKRRATYEQGKKFYNEERNPSSATMFYQKNSDSSVINIIEKEKK